MKKLFVIAQPMPAGKVELTPGVATKMLLWMLITFLEGLVLIFMGALAGMFIGMAQGVRNAVSETYADMSLLMEEWVKR